MKTPLHIQISDTLLRDIKNGNYTEKLPNERDLSKQYNVSRSTIGKSIKILVDRGIVFQKQGSGTYVNSIFVEGISDYSGYSLGPVGLSHTSSKQVIIKSKIHLLEVIRADASIASRLQINDGSFSYHILRSRHSEAGIISLEELYIPIATIPNLDESYFSDSFYNHIEEVDKIRLSKSFFNISITAPSIRHAEILNISTSDKVVKIDELVFQDNGQPFQVSIVYMISDYFSYNGISEL
ncbi:GntR family transcriptional regulator [Erysipelothrix anatis]|uniref:GntR family transcriptional regulator n=1 Tax=Erysipelothrix anatis TaxID=2683713 RepID=UPI00135B1894|nr:GntR family transcriptional regulator [Erysipelothrix anatis]